VLEKSKCPFCKREVSDILKHFVLVHGIKDMNDLIQKTEKVQEKEKAKTKFRDYVEELKKRLKDGTITAEDYRELIMKWAKEQS
jgi:hypothetical protein